SRSPWQDRWHGPNEIASRNREAVVPFLPFWLHRFPCPAEARRMALPLRASRSRRQSDPCHAPRPQPPDRSRQPSERLAVKTSSWSLPQRVFRVLPNVKLYARSQFNRKLSRVLFQSTKREGLLGEGEYSRESFMPSIGSIWPGRIS